MQCEEFLALLDDWKDGALSRDQQQQMEDHLHACSRCQSLIQMQKDLAQWALQEQPPAQFSENWKAAIHTEKQKAIRKWQNLASAAAVLTLTLGGSLLTFRSLSPQKQISATDTGIMMVRAMPSPEPTLWEKALSFAGDAWPGLVLLFAALLGAVITVRRNRR